MYLVCATAYASNVHNRSASNHNFIFGVESRNLATAMQWWMLLPTAIGGPIGAAVVIAEDIWSSPGHLAAPAYAAPYASTCIGRAI